MDDELTNLDAISRWAVDLMETLGGVILPLAGFAASRGSFGLLEALMWTTAGSVVGALMLYGLGAWLGQERLRRIVDKVPLMRVSDVDKAVTWFHRHGAKAVFLGRMVPLFRSLISIPAGVSRMSLPRFTLLTTLGSALWNTVFVLAGYQLGESWHLVEQYADVLQKVVILAVAFAATGFVVIRVIRWRAGALEP
jgi:membrane protein DedA with SNARE-associated domain